MSTLQLSATTFSDADAPGTVVGACRCLLATAELIYDIDGFFAISGDNLVTNSVLIKSGSYRPLIRAKKAGALDLTLRPTLTCSAVWAPALLSPVAFWVAGQA